MRKSLLFFLTWGSLFAAPVSWTPPETLSDQLNFNSIRPKIGSDKCGNAVVVWRTSNLFSNQIQIQGARYTASSNSWGSTSDLATGAAFTGNPDVAVSDLGRSAAVWEFQPAFSLDIVVQGAPLEKGSNTWEAAQTLSGNAIEALNPDVGIDVCGNATAIWVEGEAVLTSGTIRAARLTKDSTTWVSTENVSNDPNPTRNLFPQIAVNKCCEVVAVWISFNGTRFVIRGARLAPGSTTWQETSVASPTSVEVDETQVPSVAIDNFGNAVVVYTAIENGDTFIHAARLPAESLTWTFSNNGNPISSGDTDQNPRVAIDCIGNAVAVWGDDTNSSIEGARLLPNSDTWTQFPSSVSEDPADPRPSVAMDDFGNAIAVFANSGQTAIQAAILPALQNTWEQTDDVSTGEIASEIPEVSLNACGTVAATVWQTGDFGVTIIRGAAATNPFPPLPISGIQGFQVKNNFATQKECFNRIFWLPSPSPNITFYRILRDNIKVAKISAKKNTLFVDHNVRKGMSFTYTIIAVDSMGKESAPTSITIP